MEGAGAGGSSIVPVLSKAIGKKRDYAALVADLSPAPVSEPSAGRGVTDHSLGATTTAETDRDKVSTDEEVEQSAWLSNDTA